MKAIRNERFTSVFSLPPPSAKDSASYSADTSSQQSSYQTSTLDYHTSMNAGAGRGSGVSNAAPSNRTSNRSSQNSLSLDTSMHQSYFQQLQQQHANFPSGNQGSSNNDTESVSDTASSASRSPHPSFVDFSTSARSSGAMNFRYMNSSSLNVSEDTANPNGNDTPLRSAAPSMDNYNYYYPHVRGAPSPSHSQQQQQQPQAPAVPPQPVSALRFDRNGILSWTATSSLLYDFESLRQAANQATFYLVDEVKLKRFIAQEILLKNNGNQQQQQPAMSEEEILRASTFHMNISYVQAASGLGSVDKVCHPCL